MMLECARRSKIRRVACTEYVSCGMNSFSRRKTGSKRVRHTSDSTRDAFSGAIPCAFRRCSNIYTISPPKLSTSHGIASSDILPCVVLRPGVGSVESSCTYSHVQGILTAVHNMWRVCSLQLIRLTWRETTAEGRIGGSDEAESEPCHLSCRSFPCDSAQQLSRT